MYPRNGEKIDEYYEEDADGKYTSATVLLSTLNGKRKDWKMIILMLSLLFSFAGTAIFNKGVISETGEPETFEICEKCGKYAPEPDMKTEHFTDYFVEGERPYKS